MPASWFHSSWPFTVIDFLGFSQKANKITNEKMKILSNGKITKVKSTTASVNIVEVTLSNALGTWRMSVLRGLVRWWEELETGCTSTGQRSAHPSWSAFQCWDHKVELQEQVETLDGLALGETELSEMCCVCQETWQGYSLCWMTFRKKCFRNLNKLSNQKVKSEHFFSSKVESVWGGGMVWKISQ